MQAGRPVHSASASDKAAGWRSASHSEIPSLSSALMCAPAPRLAAVPQRPLRGGGGSPELRHHDIDAALFEKAVEPCRCSEPGSAIDDFVSGQGLGQLEQQVDVAAMSLVVESRAEQQHARARRQGFLAGAFNGATLCGRQLYEGKYRFRFCGRRAVAMPAAPRPQLPWYCRYQVTNRSTPTRTSVPGLNPTQASSSSVLAAVAGTSPGCIGR